MPTVILLDCSLSMFRPVAPSLGTFSSPVSRSVQTPDSAEERTFMSLAVAGINAFLDYLSANCKMEFVSLVQFSSLYDQVVGFTKDYNEIRVALTKLEQYNKTCLESALNGVGSLVVDEWGLSSPTQVLLVTDGSPGFGEGSLSHTVQNVRKRCSAMSGIEAGRKGGPTVDDSGIFFPFRFTSRLQVMCVTNSNDTTYQQVTLPLYNELVNLSSADANSSCSSSNGSSVTELLGGVTAVDGVPTQKSVRRIFTRYAKRTYSAYHSTLKCGNMRCPVRVFPALQSYEQTHDFEQVKVKPDKSIDICGFIDIKDIASPPHISRHILLPQPHSVANNDNGKSYGGDVVVTSAEDSDKTPALTVLLHGSLKIENMVALASIAPDWYGIIYSFADGKKKSNLFLSLLKPGVDVLPWLGKLDRLCPLTESGVELPPDSSESQILDSSFKFPISLPDKRSYNQNSIVWIKSSGLQADIQKVLRNAKRLPEKHVHFYKELNRLRRAALSLGFYELLNAVADLLERECVQLPPNAHPDCSLQMNHAASVLRSPMARESAYNIQPLRTNFSMD